jgi:hypothetical protein
MAPTTRNKALSGPKSPTVTTSSKSRKRQASNVDETVNKRPKANVSEEVEEEVGAKGRKKGKKGGKNKQNRYVFS